MGNDSLNQEKSKSRLVENSSYCLKRRERVKKNY